MRLTFKLLALFVCLLVSSCTGNRLVEDSYDNQQIKVQGELKYHKQEGVWSYYYEDGTLKSQGAWKADYQDGPWVYYYPNGKKKQEGAYVSKHRHGLWQYYYDNGNLKSMGYYDDDRQDGLWHYWREDGNLFAVGQFADGIKHGLWQWFGEAQQLAETGVICDGVRVGRWLIAGKQQDRGIPAGTMLRQAMIDGRKYCGWFAGDEAQLLAVYHDRRPIACRDPRSDMTVYLHDSCVIEQSSEHTNVYRNGRLVSDNVVLEQQLQNMANFKQGLQQAVNGMQRREPLEKPAPSVEEIIISDAGEPELTPVVHIDSLWTRREEAKVPELVKRYNFFMPGDGEDRYSSGMQRERPMQEAWLGKPLPQTRFFTSTGGVIDLNDYRGNKSVCVVVMRGFAGQVCVYCSTQTRVLAERINDFKAQDNEVIIVYPGPAETIPMFYEAVNSVGGDAGNLKIVLDVNLNLVKALNITKDLASPSSLILDKSGKVVYGYKGRNMGDRPSAKELLRYVKRVP